MDLGALDFCYLTTAGRVTGRPHRIEIWFGFQGRTVYLLAGSHESDWVRNLVTDPHVVVQLGDDRYDATARIVEDPDEAAAARRLLYEKYTPRYRGSLTGWRDRALPVAVDLPVSEVATHDRSAG